MFDAPGCTVLETSKEYALLLDAIDIVGKWTDWSSFGLRRIVHEFLFRYSNKGQLSPRETERSSVEACPDISLQSIVEATKFCFFCAIIDWECKLQPLRQLLGWNG